MNSTIEPVLAAPGAGLPMLELLVGRTIFTLRRLTGDRLDFEARFLKEQGLIRALVASCDAEAAGRRVLIARVRGMEDSSRYWSVWMTLEHLRIVNEAFIGVIEMLGRGVVPEVVASTAAVKPRTDAGAEVVPAYEASCDVLLKTAAAVPNLKTQVRFAHPWFGELNAAGWHALGGFHLGIHRVQIERILEGLAAT